jgi:hypothetical protein
MVLGRFIGENKHGTRNREARKIKPSIEGHEGAQAITNTVGRANFNI